MSKRRWRQRRDELRKWAVTGGTAALVIAALVMGWLAFTSDRQGLAEARDASNAAPAATVTPTPSAPPRPVRSVFFAGDSLTVGWHAPTEAEGFRALMVGMLAERGLDASGVMVAAKAGAKLAEVAASYEVPSGVDLAVVELGTNDAAQGSDPVTFAADYAAYLDRVKAASPEARLVCVGVWFLASESATRPLDEAIRSGCQSAGGTFVPVSALVSDASLRGPVGKPTWVGPSDNFHPNSSGHETLARRIMRAVS